MDQLKRLLSSILANRLDRVNIILNLNKLKEDFDDDEPLAILKYKLQLRVVETLCKDPAQEGQNEYYERLREESKGYLAFHHKEDRRKFQCSLVGCLFKCNQHKYYLRHLRRAHSQETRIVCQFGLKCSMTFSSIELLLQHLNNVHKNAGPSRDSIVPEPVPVDIPCKCKMRSCSGAEFSNMKKLMTHLRNDHVGQVIECIFEHCHKSFNNTNSLRLHFSVKHLKLNLCSLKAVHKIGEAHKICPDQALIEEESEINDPAVSEENLDEE